MKKCVFCSSPFEAATPVVELVGGLFDPEDPEFFVVDEGVMPVRYAHLACLVKKATAGK